MFSTKSPVKRLLLALAASGCLLTGFQAITVAQNNSGVYLWGGVKRENILSYRLDSGTANNWDRYKLRIPNKKLDQGASKFIISYPDYYEGKFDPDNIEVRVGKESLPLEEVIWDKESYLVEIVLKEPLIPGQPPLVGSGNSRRARRRGNKKKVEIVFHNVKKPSLWWHFLF